MGKGKKTGKALLGIAGFFLGAGSAGQAFFGTSSSIMGGLYGASLASTLWSTFTPQKNQTTQDFSRFDALMNTVSSESMIPIIYGERKWSGNQTWHDASDDKTVLTKDIVVGEGEIESISDVRANDLSINGAVNLSIVNTTNPNARVFAGKMSSMSKISIGLFTGPSTFDAIVSVKGTYQDICDIINRYPGWSASTQTPNSPAVINKFSEVNCYNKPKTISVDALPGCSYVFQNGASTQEPPDNYEVVGGYKNMAWLRATLKYSEKLTGSNPTITSIVKGIKVLCWDGSTWVKQWSENPSYCLLDFLTNKGYGLGKWITWDMLNLDSFREAADYCDELITTKVPTTLATYDAVQSKIAELENLSNLSDKEQAKVDKEIIRLNQSLIDIQNSPVQYTLEVTPRYTLNIVIDQKKDAVDHLSDILSNFAGFLVFSNNRISLRIEKATPVSYEFDDSTIIPDSVEFNGIPSENRPNQYIIGFFDPANNWTQVRYLVEDTVDQKDRGKIIKKEITLTGCTNLSQALRLGNMFRDISKLCPNTITFQTATYAMHLEPGDVVTVTQETYIEGERQLLLDKIPVRILEISKANGTYTIKAQQYNESVYNDNLGAQIEFKDYTPIPNPISESITDVTDLSYLEHFRNLGNGQWVNEVTLSWTPLDAFYKHAEIYMLSNNPTFDEIDVGWDDLDGTWNDLTESTNAWKYIGSATEKISVSNLVKGLTYTFKIVTVNTLDRKSSFTDAPTVEFYCRGKTLTPSTPTGLTLSITDVCSWSWNMGDADVDFWELRTDMNPGEESGLLLKTTTNKATVTPPSRQGTVFLYAHNTGEFYSSPASYTYNHPAPSAPQSLVITQVFQGFTVDTEALPVYGLGINVHVDSQIFFSQNNSYTYKSTGGIYDVQVAFVDLFGEGNLSTVQQVIIEPTIDPELIAAESISLEKVDAHLKDAVAKAQAAVDPTTFDAAIDSLNDSMDALDQAKVSHVEFSSTVNELVQVDTENKSLITQTAGSLTSVIANLNKAPGSTGYTSITQIKQTADALAATVATKASAADLTITNDSITAMVGKLNSAPGASGQYTAISQLKQTADSLSSTIADLQTKDTSLQSQITQTAGSLTSVITELNKAPGSSSYSSITQLLSAVNLRVLSTTFNAAMVPNQLITQINLAPGTITLDGKLVHITGDTLIDGNVITTGMIKSGAVTATHMSSNTVSAMFANLGTFVSTGTNGKTTISGPLYTVHDENGQLRVRLGRW